MKRILIIVLIFTFASNQWLTAQEFRTFTSIKEAMKDPLAVKKLDLQGKKLTRFPHKIIKCRNLEVLNLSNNQIDSIPKVIGKLTKLKKLHMSKNRLIHVSFEINLGMEN